MAELYIALHCLENSVRALVRKVLKGKFGDEWWNESANTDIKSRLEGLKAKEAKNLELF